MNSISQNEGLLEVVGQPSPLWDIHPSLILSFSRSVYADVREFLKTL